MPDILRNIEESPELRSMWEKHRKQFAYAADIEYDQIMGILKHWWYKRQCPSLEIS